MSIDPDKLREACRLLTSPFPDNWFDAIAENDRRREAFVLVMDGVPELLREQAEMLAAIEESQKALAFAWNHLPHAGQGRISFAKDRVDAAIVNAKGATK